MSSRSRLIPMCLTACALLLAACDRGAPGRAAKAKPTGVVGGAVGPRPTYVGLKSCAGCHAQAVEEWKGSHHDLAMQEVSDKTVLGDFNDVSFAYHEVTSTFSRKDGKFMVRTDGPDGVLHDYEIAYTYGVDPLQQYLIKFPDGRIQALNVCWDTRPKSEGGQRWFHLYPDENVDHTDILHWTGPFQNWNYMCAECHSTDVKKNYEAKADTFSTTWSEINVSCEACHGPGSEHVKWAAARKGSKEVPPPGDSMGLVAFLKEAVPPQWELDAARGIVKRTTPRTTHAELDTCARCHARRGMFSEGALPAQPLADTHRLALLDQAIYHADGQILDEDYEYGSFLQSKMHAAGVTCTDCHTPHRFKVAGNNDTCAKCHVPAKFDTPEHHHHEPGTPGARCINCHAPTKNYMVVHARHDHSFRVPRPDLTTKIGTPNACNGCHADKSTDWAAENYSKWWGTTRAGQPHYGEAIAAGRGKLAGAGAALARLAVDVDQPAIVRASAVQLFEAAEDIDARPTLRRLVLDHDPIVRAAAARVLGLVEQSPAELIVALTPLLTDPVRLVRMDAARALVRVPATSLTPAQQEARAGALREFREGELLNADRAESRLNMGLLAAEEGDFAKAEAEYLAGIRLSPRFAPCAVNLADLYRVQGKEELAEKTLRQAIGRAPKDASVRHSLGLALVRQKRLDEALGELRRACELDPAHAGYSFVYAVALDSTGNRAMATSILKKLVAAHPGEAGAVETLALYALEAKDSDAALAWARLLIKLRPNDPRAAQLLRQVESAGPLATPPGAR